MIQRIQNLPIFPNIQLKFLNNPNTLKSKKTNKPFPPPLSIWPKRKWVQDGLHGYLLNTICCYILKFPGSLPEYLGSKLLLMLTTQSSDYIIYGIHSVQETGNALIAISDLSLLFTWGKSVNKGWHFSLVPFRCSSRSHSTVAGTLPGTGCLLSVAALRMLPAARMCQTCSRLFPSCWKHDCPPHHNHLLLNNLSFTCCTGFNPSTARRHEC